MEILPDMNFGKFFPFAKLVTRRPLGVIAITVKVAWTRMESRYI